MLANRNSTIANAQMLLVLKYIDNEIIKNRDYNTKYGLKRKIVVVIDEAHVFIDTKFPIALDFMFQLAKRIRKYNGMQIVITQNIKDFVGSEDIARKSSAIINACQYSFVFGLAPNDMSDLCKLYEKAGGINETEQEDILQAKRGQAFTIMSPTSRSSFMIEVPDSFVDMFESSDFISNYFSGEEGDLVWEDFVSESREAHDRNYKDRVENEKQQSIRKVKKSSFSFSEITEEELKSNEQTPQSAVDKMIAAEEYVNQKEYEILTGRFGSINLQEVDENDLDEEEEIEAVNDAQTYEEPQEEYEEEYSEEEYSEEEYSEEEYDDLEAEDDFDIELSDGAPVDIEPEPQEEPVKKETVKPEKVYRFMHNGKEETISVPKKETEKVYTQAEVDQVLDSFKKSLREELEKDLEDKLKWIALGASVAGAGAVSASSAVAEAAEAPVSRMQPEESVKPKTPEPEEEEEEQFTSDLFADDYEDETDDFESDGYESDDLESDDYEADDFDSDEDENEFFFDDDEDEEGYIPDDSDEDEDIFAPEEPNYEEDEEDEDDDDDDINFFDDDDSFYFDSDSEEYEPAPFLFAELLAEAADEYANMDIEERMAEMNEQVLEISVEELGEYIKQQRKKK